MRACWLKWVGRDWSISADYIWLNYSGANNEQGIVYLSDSINGNVTRNAQVFFGTWQQMDSQAVVIE